MRKIRNRKGFTLIELMIVVVIIGILAAIAIPKFNQASARAKEKEADGILKQIYTLQMTYTANHGVPAAAFTDLLEVGWESPATSLKHYTLPADPTLPATMAKTGTGYCDRVIDANGRIDPGAC
jgi:prepilin-type N-terminal cleavage/methylation domain-containing protein